MTLLFFRDFFMSYVEILKYNSASFITYSVIWVAREVIFSYWYTNIYAADVSAQVFLNFLKCNARVIWNPRAPVGGNPWRTGGFNLIFTRFRLPCSQGMHLFFHGFALQCTGVWAGFSCFAFKLHVRRKHGGWSGSSTRAWGWQRTQFYQENVFALVSMHPQKKIVYHTLLGVLQRDIICVSSALLLKVIFYSIFQ